MSVIIGVEPHKATHTVVVIDRSESELARARIRATRKQVPQLLRHDPSRSIMAVPDRPRYRRATSRTPDQMSQFSRSDRA